jgi:hypothetical protein
VKVQYFGDVNDYRKFALLRLLSEVGGFKIGVCWMLTEADGSAQGAKRSYLKQPEVWRAHDPALFDALEKVPASPQLSDLQRIEAEGIVPGATFFNEFCLTPEPAVTPFTAAAWRRSATETLYSSTRTTGLRSAPKGRKRSSKYVLLDEVAGHYGAGRSVLVYQQLGHHLPRKAFTEEKATKLRAVAAGASVSAFDTAHVVFLLAARREHAKRVVAIGTAAKSMFGPSPSFRPVLGEASL